jgi:hypothetical protein
MNNLEKKLRLCSIVGVFCAVLALPGLASAQLAAEIEGRIDPGSVMGDEALGATMTVMGIPVVITDLTTIHSPSNPDLRDATGVPEGLLSPAQLPNRAENGFEGGTAIVIGTTGVGPNGDFVIVAEDVFVEPAENVALGQITRADPSAVLPTDGSLPADGAFLVNGVPLHFLADERIPFEGAIDPNGFPVTDFNLITDGGAAAVAGYYAGGFLNVFTLEAEATLPPNEDAISIERSRCRDGNRLETRGVTSAAVGTVTVTYDNGLVAQVGITADPLGGGTYAHRDAIGTCPSSVTVALDGTAATTTATVQVR